MKRLQLSWVMTLAILVLFQTAPCPLAETGTPFRAVDVVVDSGETRLAAWQVEVRLAHGSVLVGVEGGAAPFAEPASHDPRALHSGRVVLAAFSTRPEDALPNGRVRVARLHLRVGDELDPLAKLQAAADADGRRVQARVFLVPVEN